MPSRNPWDAGSRFLATLAYVGFFPVAPGTAGTAVAAVALWMFRDAGPGAHLIGLLFLIGVGIPVSDRTERLSGGVDPGCIVIDEAAGFWMAMLFVPPTAGMFLGGFILFRLFDIAKPVGIRKLEKRFQGGLGIMIDDLAAGGLANLCLQAGHLIASTGGLIEKA